MKEISPSELKLLKDTNQEFQLIDVREIYEHELSNLGGELIPLGAVLESVDKFRKDIPVIVYCRSGGRSGMAIFELQKKFGYDNLINLKGGILAYARDIDPSLET